LDFFESQSDARQRSRRLVFLFVAAVASMIGVVYLTLLLVLGFAWGGFAPQGPGTAGWFNPELLAAVSVGMVAIIGLGSLIRTAQLRKGGVAVAELLGGRPVSRDTSDPLERRLLNVVDEMSIAAGVPVPAVFVLDREAGINAFAAGHTIHDAAVGFTRGSLEALSRDELQGVVAHEFSHILNGDMRLNLRLIGLLFGILLLTIVGRGMVRGGAVGRGRGRGGGPQVAVIGLVLIALGYLGVLFGRLIQAAVSREREYLADAAAVQFTRNPDGIAGALRKIGGARGSEVRDHHAQEAEHLFFANGIRSSAAGVLATHPPLDERIRRIDPAWDGSFIVPEAASSVNVGNRQETSTSAGHSGRPSGSSGPLQPATDGMFGDPDGRMFPLAAILLASVGSPGAESLDRARKLLSSVSDELREAVRTPEGATAVLVALLLFPGDRTTPATGDAHDTREGGSLDRVEGLFGSGVATRVAQLSGAVAASGPEARLPLVELSLPALRELPASDASGLQGAVGELIRADGRIDSFEFAVYHILRRNLESAAGPVSPSRPGTVPLSRLRTEVEAVLSALARTGALDEEAARQAFDAGTSHLGDPPAQGWRLHPAGAVGLDQVDAALDRLRIASPDGLRLLLKGAIATVLGDGEVRVEEVEVLRAFAEALDVPIPAIGATG